MDTRSNSDYWRFLINFFRFTDLDASVRYFRCGNLYKIFQILHPLIHVTRCTFFFNVPRRFQSSCYVSDNIVLKVNQLQHQKCSNMSKLSGAKLVSQLSKRNLIHKGNNESRTELVSGIILCWVFKNIFVLQAAFLLVGRMVLTVIL